MSRQATSCELIEIFKDLGQSCTAEWIDNQIVFQESGHQNSASLASTTHGNLNHGVKRFWTDKS